MSITELLKRLDQLGIVLYCCEMWTSRRSRTSSVRGEVTTKPSCGSVQLARRVRRHYSTHF